MAILRYWYNLIFSAQGSSRTRLEMIYSAFDIKGNIFFHCDLIIHTSGGELHHAVHVNKNSHIYIYIYTCLINVTEVCLCCVCKDSYGRDQGSSGGGEENCQWWTAGKYLGTSTHGQNRAVALVQPATGRRRREVWNTLTRSHTHTTTHEETWTLLV